METLVGRHRGVVPHVSRSRVLPAGTTGLGAAVLPLPSSLRKQHWHFRVEKKVTLRPSRKSNVVEVRAKKPGAGLKFPGTFKLLTDEDPSSEEVPTSNVTEKLQKLPGTSKIAAKGRGRPKDKNVVFVAGATSRVGRRVVRELVQQGYSVRAGVRNVDTANFLLEIADVSSNKEAEQKPASLWSNFGPEKIFGFLSAKKEPRVELVELDLEYSNVEEIEEALGNAGVVICAVGASEKEAFNFSAPYRIDFKATESLINAATNAKVNHFVLVSSLGTNKVGWPVSALNLFWGVLIWKGKAEKALVESGIPFTIVRPGGMEKPTDAFKETHNLVLDRADSRFYGQVSTLQVAELIAGIVNNSKLSQNKIIEVVAETTAPLRDIEDLLAEIPSIYTTETVEEAVKGKIAVPNKAQEGDKVKRGELKDAKQRAEEERIAKQEERKAAKKREEEAKIAKREELKAAKQREEEERLAAQERAAAEKEKAEALRQKLQDEYSLARQKEEEAKKEAAAARLEKEEIEKEAAEVRARAEAAVQAALEAKALQVAITVAARQGRKLTEAEKTEIVASVRAEKEKAARKVKEEEEAQAAAEKAAKVEAEQRRKAEEAKALAAAEQKRKAEEAERLAKANKAKADEEKRAKDEAERKAKIEAGEKARVEAETKAKAEAEEKVRVEAERKAQAEAEEKARVEAETKAKAEAEEKARVEAETKKAEAEEKARVEAETKAKAEAEEKARVEAETKAKAEAEEKARVEAERKAKAEAEEKARVEAEVRAKAEAEEKARVEAELKAKEEAEEKAKVEAEIKAKAEAEEKPKAEAEIKGKEEEEEKRKLEAAKEEIETKVSSEEENSKVERAVVSGQVQEKQAPKQFRWPWQKEEVVEEVEAVTNDVVKETPLVAEEAVQEKSKELLPSSTPLSPFVQDGAVKPPSSPTPSPPTLEKNVVESALEVIEFAQQASVAAEPHEENAIEESGEDAELQRIVGAEKRIETEIRERLALEKAKSSATFRWPWQKGESTTDVVEAEATEVTSVASSTTTTESITAQDLSRSSKPLSPYPRYPGLRPPTSPTPSPPATVPASVEKSSQEEQASSPTNGFVDLKPSSSLLTPPSIDEKEIVETEIADKEAAVVAAAQEALESVDTEKGGFIWPWQKRNPSSTSPTPVPETAPQSELKSSTDLPRTSRPLSPYWRYPDLKPPTSPTPSPPSIKLVEEKVEEEALVVS